MVSGSLTSNDRMLDDISYVEIDLATERTLPSYLEFVDFGFGTFS